MFKAAELLNALIQIRERRQAPDRLGDAFAKASFQRVRQVIRDRRIVLQGGEVIDLRDPVLRDMIDEGCRLFHAGRKDAEVYQRALALAAAWLMLRPPQAPEPARQREGRIQLLVQGLGVGLLTGIAGVGGGFAIVPALVLLARLPMTLASGTSLLVICASSLMALVRHGHWPAASLPLLLPLLLGGGIGILLGQRWVSRVSERRLRQGFAALLLVSAISTGLEALQPQRPSTEAGLRISTRWPEA